MDNPGQGSGIDIPVDVPSAEKTMPRNELITIAGGVEIEVTHLDGSKETVKVRQIQVSKIQQFAFAISWGNMADAIALYCDKPKEWVDTLDGGSAIAVAEKGRELNLPFFEAWSKDQAKWKEAMGKDRIAELERDLAIAKKQLELLTSVLPSPTTTNASPGK